MESTSLTSKSPPPTPHSARPTPPPRNSMEDEDASVKRKRPRLDSGERTYLHMSADHTSPGQQSSDAATTEKHINMSYDGNHSGSPFSFDTQPEQFTPSPPPTAATDQDPQQQQQQQQHQALGTPSKVTLNLRDSNSSASPSKQSMSLSQPHSTSSMSQEKLTADAPPHNRDASPTPASPSTLVSDEAVQDSIEIEVAEPEDIDDPPEATIWHPAPQLNWHTWHQDTISRFPLIGDSRSPWNEAFNDYWGALIAGAISMEKILRDTNHWVESYLDESEGVPSRWADLLALDPHFWKQFSRLFRSLPRDEFLQPLRQGCSSSSSGSGPGLGDGDKSMSTLFVDLFENLIRLTTRLMKVDQMSLEAANAQKSSEVQLFSAEFVGALAVALCNKKVMIILDGISMGVESALEKIQYQLNSEPLLWRIAGMCWTAALEQNRSDNSHLDILLQIIRLVQDTCTTWATESIGAEDQAATLASHLFDLHVLMSENMHSAVKKQFSMINGDFFVKFTACMSTVVQRTILSNNELIHRAIDASSRDAAAILPANDQSMFASTTWRIRFQERCIREGRMEIRITALEELSKLLIEIYHKYIQTMDNTDHIIVQWTSSWLRESNIINYLFSADSHPQLVSRSSNVIGFLAASHTYSAEQTDMIWQCVQTSEDPRMFEQIVASLTTTFGLLESEPLLYFCSKFQEVPAAEFDGRRRHLLTQILIPLSKQWAQGSTVDFLPYRILLRLLREAGTDPRLSRERRNELWNFVLDILTRGTPPPMTPPHWNFDQRFEIYKECLEDYARAEGGTSGTCLILNRLIDSYGQTDLLELSARRNDLAELVVSEFTQLKLIQAKNRVDLEDFNTPVKERLHMLEKVLLWLAERVTPELARALWPSLVGPNAIGPSARNDAWDSLAVVARHSSVPNILLEVGTADYLASLDPSLHTRSLLSFAHTLWDYQSRMAAQTAADPYDASIQPRDNIFWQLALGGNDDYLSSGAIRFLVDRVVQETKTSTKDHLSIAQADFVQRTITQLTEAAEERRLLVARLRHPDRIDGDELVADSAVLAATTRFHRAFMMLKQLGQSLKALEPDLPSERSDSLASRPSLQGERVEIKYQTSDRGVAGAIKVLEIGDLSTVAELVETLRSRTGFSKFNLIAGGQKVNQETDASNTIASCRLHERGALIVHKIPGTESTKAPPPVDKSRPLEQEIMKYFHSLYDLMSVGSGLAQSVLDFLTTFAPHEDTVQLVSSASNTMESILPLTEPYKLLYSLHAMKHVLQRQLEEGAMSEDFMIRSVTRLTETLLSMDLSSSATNATNNLVAHNIAHVLLMLLKEPVLPSTSGKYFHSPKLFVDKIFEMCHTTPREACFAVHQTSFAILLEAARLNTDVWKNFTEHSITPDIFKLLLLVNPKVEGRISAQKTVLSVLATLVNAETSPENIEKQKDGNIRPAFAFEVSSFLAFIWKTLTSILPEAAEHSKRSMSFFELSVEVFRMLKGQPLEAESLQGYLDDWLTILLQFPHEEVIGQEGMDRFVRGTCELIVQCLMAFSTTKAQPEVNDLVFMQIFNTFLFPPVVRPDSRQSIAAAAPILNSETRNALYKIAIWLSKDDARLLTCIRYADQALAEVSDMSFPWNYERFKNIRSSAGYPGLNNLSNTCYLNSLTTQLFMNPRFREFLLALDLFDTNSQKLLFALRQTFADLQDGWGKSVHTQDLADSIDTYEGPLDPAIQMDVDEAFNLIFDRIESQLSSKEDKQRFKKLYGGQIVQQIKSKECDHISERLEPVTAVQCDIQGKSNLEDSLKSYIEGEVMEGDNKYKCSTCDRYVNAVKRACLRDIPDNLIFHLKRFDFDLVQGTRNKLNDYFSFPENIDMTPYTDKYLQDPTSSSEADRFLLTGVLVHSGTAELGHYYSFIRERPIYMQSWVEFNDADVSRYDLRQMQEHCFGGEYRDQYSGATYPRMYNAYMLFYQRFSSLKLDDDIYQDLTIPRPVKKSVPHEIALEIAFKNELLARTFCLFDPTHVKFLKDIDSKRFLLHGSGRCSDDHKIETSYIHCVWQHILYVFGRESTRQGCNEMLHVIGDMMGRCLQCCEASIEWLVGGTDEMRLRMLLLRLPEPGIRVSIGSLLCDGLRRLRELNPQAYGPSTVDSDVDDDDDSDIFKGGLFVSVMAKLRALQRLLPYHPRAWIDFYDLLTTFSGFGMDERCFMQHAGFLRHGIEIMLIDNEHDWSSIFHTRHQYYTKTLEKRHFNLAGLARFLGAMLPPTILSRGRAMSNGGSEGNARRPIGRLTAHETDMVLFSMNASPSHRNLPWFIDRLADSDDVTVTYHEPLKDVVRALIRTDSAGQMMARCEALVSYGLEKNPAWLAESYLHIALALMEAWTEPERIELLMKMIAESVQTIANCGGLEHLDFFKRVQRVRNNDAFPEQPDQLKLLSLQLSRHWAPTLFLYPKDGVAEKTRRFFEELWQQHQTAADDDEEQSDARQTAFDDLFNALVRELTKLLSRTNSLGEHCGEILKYCEFYLPFSYTNKEENAMLDSREDVQALISRVQSHIVVSDDGSHVNGDSDDLTDVSSNLNFQDARGKSADDPIEL